MKKDSRVSSTPTTINTKPVLVDETATTSFSSSASSDNGAERKIEMTTNPKFMRIPSTIVSRRLNVDTCEKAMRFLEETEQIYEGNLCCHMLSVSNGSDDNILLDAMLQIQENKISIKKIWVLDFDQKKGMFSPRNADGERGKYVKILCEKYFNSFCDHLDTVDIDNVEPQSFLLTAEVIEKIESEIDQSIDPTNIAETDIGAYNRIEMTLPVKQALEYFCTRIGEEDYKISCDEESQTFEVEFCTSDLNITIPLGDIVHRKWEMNESLAKAALACLGDLYLEADERKKRDDHYITQLMDRAMPNLQKIAGQDQEKLEELKGHCLGILENQIDFYDVGREHSEARDEKWNRNELINQCDGLEEVKHETFYIDMLYTAYSNGFDKLNGDTLFSGEGSLLLPAIFHCG